MGMGLKETIQGMMLRETVVLYWAGVVLQWAGNGVGATAAEKEERVLSIEGSSWDRRGALGKWSRARSSGSPDPHSLLRAKGGWIGAEQEQNKNRILLDIYGTKMLGEV